MAPELPASMRIFERGWLSSNNVLFTGPGQTALVDSGYVTHAPQTLALVRHALGERPLEGAYGCRTTIPAAETDKVRAWDEDALSYRATGQQCARFAFDDTIAPGDELELGALRWQALAAPGHDPHALLLFCAGEGILIAGDALWENGFGVIFPELAGEPGFADQRATLALIAGLDVRLVIPGHGKPFTDARAALVRAGARLDYLAADPVRNAENALKVMLKFLLLERRAVPLAQVAPLLASIPLAEHVRRTALQRSPDELGDWLVGALVRAGAARREGPLLVDL
jgi:glyoxylase-like metal-dependent hydrolase (beta-lactamase superfamily II)